MRRGIVLSGRTQRGFTLLEISIVLLIIAVIIGGGFVTLTASLNASQFNATVARMNAIDKMLLDYSRANTRIPCPSDLTIKPGTPNYGVEAATQGTCYGGTPSGNHQSASGTVEGGVPTRTLRLPDAYMYDAWGRRFRYAVDPHFTTTGTLAANSTGACTGTGIQVNDAAGAARTTAAIYALISHGANGHGGYTINGTPVNKGSVNMAELANCNCNSSGSFIGGYNTSGSFLGAYSPIYVQKLPTASSTNTLDAFDDIVSFREAWQMQTNYSPALSCGGGGAQYIYVDDMNNALVQKFNSSGSFIMQWGGWGSGPGQFNTPVSIASDSNGNIWVADTWNARIQKFNSSGSWLLSTGSSGTGNGQFTNIAGHGCTVCAISVDGNGNLWAADQGNYRIEKFNSSGSWLMTVGGGPGCYNCASGTSCSCTQDSGSGNGLFNSIFGVATDSAGNIYGLNGSSSGNVEKFNSSGSFIMQWSVGYPDIVAMSIDANDNVYIPEDDTCQTTKYNASGSLIATLGAGCGSGNGEIAQWYTNGVTFDANGNIWITDPGNTRVEKLNSGGSWLMTVGGGASCTGCASGSSCSCSSGSGSGLFSSDHSPPSVAVTSR